MADREQLYTALRNADAAGDTAAAQRLAGYIQSLPAEDTAPTGPLRIPQAPPSGGDSTIKRALAGAALGVSDIGNTALNFLTAPIAAISPTVAQWNRTRNADFEALTEQNKDSTAFKVGRVGGNIAATLPVGGTIGAGVRTVAALPRLAAAAPRLGQLASAVASGGMKTGAALGADATIAARAADMGIRMAGGAITGGASSALVNPDSAGTGAIIGGALPPALVGAGKLASYAGTAAKSLVQPFTEAGQKDIAAKIIQSFGKGGPMEVNTAELVPGSLPTLAEATGNAGIATLQRGARDLKPNAFVEREAANAAARNALFDQTAGDTAAINSAAAERDSAANSLYGQAFTADAMRRSLAQGAQQTRAPFSGVGLSGAAEDLATPGLRDLASRPMFAQAVQDAKRLAANKGVKLDDPLQSLEGLHYIKLALDDALNPAAKSAMGRNASGAVMDMRDKLAGELAQVSPLYGNARQTFAEMSQPINAMEALQGLKLTDKVGNMTLAKTKNAIQSLEKLRKAPGVNPAKSVTEDQLGNLQAIHDDLLRQDAINGGRSAGSPTFQNIATDNILSSFIPGPLGGMVRGKVGGIVGQVGKLAYSGPNEAIRSQLTDMLLTPELAKAALARQSAIGGPSAVERLLQAQRLQQSLSRIAPVGFRPVPILGNDQ